MGVEEGADMTSNKLSIELADAVCADLRSCGEEIAPKAKRYEDYTERMRLEREAVEVLSARHPDAPRQALEHALTCIVTGIACNNS